MSIFFDRRRILISGDNGISYPGSSGRFSLEDISGGTNPLVARVKAGVQAERDFTATEWLDGTLLTYCGVDDGIMIGVYNQEDGILWTANNQTIKVVESGVIKTIGGRPCWEMPAGSWITSGAIFNQSSIFGYAKMNSLNLINYLWYASNGGAWFGGTFTGATGVGLFDGTSFVSSTIEDFNPHTVSVINNGVDETSLYVDGAYEGGLPSRTFNINNIGRSQSSLSFNGSICELVTYPSNETANRTEIETKISR